jgi:cysteine desulfurase
MKRIYLDYAATTPMHPEVANAMIPYFSGNFGNASSIYSYGQEAKSAIDKARTKLATFIGAREEEIIFTSGGTEADNLALKGVAFANKNKGNHIIVSSVEHHAVIATCKFLEEMGFTLTFVPVDKTGLVDPGDIKKAVTSKTILVSIMHANNEIGTIEPIADISKITREADIYFHTDAVQTLGHIPVNVSELGIDLLSMSAHKLYGPKGVGALYVRKGTKLASIIHGGAQEKRRRAGTENVPGIVGFGKAIELAQIDIVHESARLTLLRDQFIEGLSKRIKDIHLNGHAVRRLPNNINVTIDFIEGESISLNLDLEGICASTGSACSSSSLEPSHVLQAMGMPPEQSHGSLRFTLGKWTTEKDILRVLDVLPRIVTKLRSISPLFKARDNN